MPEVWRGRFEFDWGVKAFGHGLRAANDFAGDTFLGSGMFEDELGGDRKALFQDQQRAVVADADGGGIESGLLALQGDMNAGTDAEKDPLTATAFVGGDRWSADRDGRL